MEANVPPQLGQPAMVGGNAEERSGCHEHGPALTPALGPPKPALEGGVIGKLKRGAVMCHQPLFQLLPGSHLIPKTPQNHFVSLPCRCSQRLSKELGVKGGIYLL